MKKQQISDATLEIPEIPENAVLRRARHQLPINARMPKKKVTLDLDVDILAWFESEARRGGLNRNDRINEILRQYIIDLVGDKPASPSLSKQQRDEVRKIVDDTLVRKGFAQHAAT